MTGVQTCALPICFPVTIRNLEEMTKNIKEKEDFYAKYFEEKEKIKQDIDKKLFDATEGYTTKVREYNAEILETETKLASIELVRRRKFMQLENDCKEYERSERERIATDARIALEKLQEDNRNKAIQDDESERNRLKVERETEHAIESEKLKKNLIAEIELETNTKKKEFSDKLNKFYELEEKRLVESFASKKIAIERELDDINKFNTAVNVESLKKFITDFSNTVNKEYHNLDAEIEGRRMAMLSEIDETLRQYKVNKKHEIDREYFSLKSSNLKELEDDMKLLKDSKIRDIEKECNGIKIRKLNETYAEILAESEKHKKLLAEREIMLEKQRIMTHNDKLKTLESEFSFKFNEASKKHLDAVEEMKQSLANNHVRIQEKLNEELETLKKQYDRESNEYKLKLHEEIEIERNKMSEELKKYRETLMKRAMDEHETERGILRQERESEHNNEIALLMQTVSKTVSDRENEMTFNMMNELLKKREQEELRIEAEVKKYKNDLINEAEASIKELTRIQEILNKSNFEAEEKRIEAFQESQRMCIDMLNELENKRMLEIEADLIKRMSEVDEGINWVTGLPYAV